MNEERPGNNYQGQRPERKRQAGKNNGENNNSDNMSMADRFITAMFLPNEYNSLLKLKMSKVISYFCVLILLASVVQFAIPALAAVAGYGGVRAYILNELPEFSLKNGELFVDEVIEEDNSDAGVYMIVNTDVVKYTEDDIPKEMLQAMMVSKTNIIMYNNITGMNGLVQEQPFSLYGSLNIDNESIAAMAPVIYVCMFFIFVMLYIVSFVRFLLAGVMYAVIMLLLSKILMTDLSFGKIFEISLFAQTVNVLVTAVAYCIGSDVLILSATTFGMIITVLIMNRVLFKHSGRPESRS